MPSVLGSRYGIAAIFSYALVFTMIERLLGGGGQPSPVVRRPLTEIESGLFLRLTEHWRAVLKQRLSANAEVNLRSLRVESHSERLPTCTGGQLTFIEMPLRELTGKNDCINLRSRRREHRQ